MRTAQRRVVLSLLVGLWLSGLVWLGVHYGLRGHDSFGLPVISPLEPLCLAVHGAFAFLSLALAGWLLAAHFPPAWRSQRSRASGLTLVTTGLLLIISGYLLYYATGDQTRQLVSLFHWIVGVAAICPLLWHLLVRHRSTRHT